MSGPTAPNTEVDALFLLPLGEFTAARNALVAQLKKAGRQAEANEAKALAKPSVSAWVVNQLYWRHREVFDRLIEAGDRLRRTQAKHPTGDAARAAVSARREALAELAGIAAGLLRDGDHGATRDLLRRVTSTLDALSSYGSLPNAPVAGRLADDVEPPGFEAVAGFLPATTKDLAGDTPIPTRPSKAAPVTTSPRRSSESSNAVRRAEKEHRESLAAAKAAVREAERTLSSARKRAERAASKSDAATVDANEIERQRAQLEKRLAQASKEAAAAHERASEAAAEAAEATQAAQGAERALELARQRLQQLAGNG